MKYIVIVVLLILVIVVLLSMGKKAKMYNLRKEYSLCYKLVLTDSKKAHERLENSILKCQEYSNYEFVCKLAILKLITDIDCKMDLKSTSKHINIDNLFCKNGKYSSNKAIWNMDSLYFISIDMIKTFQHGQKDVTEYLWQQANKYNEQLNGVIEFQLCKAIHSSLFNIEDKGVDFYNELSSKKYETNKGDNRTMDIYQKTALIMKKLLGIKLSKEEVNKINEFSKTLLGKMIVN